MLVYCEVEEGFVVVVDDLGYVIDELVLKCVLVVCDLFRLVCCFFVV